MVSALSQDTCGQEKLGIKPPALWFVDDYSAHWAYCVYTLYYCARVSIYINEYIFKRGHVNLITYIADDTVQCLSLQPIKLQCRESCSFITSCYTISDYYKTTVAQRCEVICIYKDNTHKKSMHIYTHRQWVAGNTVRKKWTKSLHCSLCLYGAAGTWWHKCFSCNRISGL